MTDLDSLEKLAPTMTHEEEARAIVAPYLSSNCGMTPLGHKIADAIAAALKARDEQWRSCAFVRNGKPDRWSIADLDFMWEQTSATSQKEQS